MPLAARVPLGFSISMLVACTATPVSRFSSFDDPRCSYQEHEQAVCEQLRRAVLLGADGERVPLDVSRCSGGAPRFDVTWVGRDTGVFAYRGRLAFSAASPRAPMTARSIEPTIDEWPCTDDGCKTMRDLPADARIALPIVQPCPGAREAALGGSALPLAPATICSDGGAPRQRCVDQEEGTEHYSIEQVSSRTGGRRAVIEVREEAVSIRDSRGGRRVWPKDKSEPLRATLADLWQAPLFLDESCRDGTVTRIRARKPGAWRTLVRSCGDFPQLEEALSERLETSAPAARPPRRDECRVDEAMRAFVGGGPFVACGELGPEASPSEYEALVKCVIDANRAKKPFLALVQVPGIDSTFALGYAGRKEGEQLKVRELRYDSSPSGRENPDPTWDSVVCNPLVDATRACASLPTVPHPDGMEAFCTPFREGPAAYPGNPLRWTTLRLGLFCASGTEPESCP